MKGPEGLTVEQQILVPIHAYMRQLQQEATQKEWDGDLEGCDLILSHLNTVVEYHQQTGSLFYPMF